MDNPTDRNQRPSNGQLFDRSSALFNRFHRPTQADKFFVLKIRHGELAPRLTPLFLTPDWHSQ
jgi:hypothetical protein